MDLPEALSPDQYVIYALSDPTDDLVYYVGQTHRPKGRFSGHLSERLGRNAKATWLRSLEEQGLQPRMNILETVMGLEAALQREQAWICCFLDQGMPLVNRKVQADAAFPLPQIFQLVRQETIAVCGCPVTRVRLPDGRTALVLNRLLKHLAFTPRVQVQQMLNHPVIRKYLVYVPIKTENGSRIAVALVEGAFSLWLAGIRLNRLSPEKREFVYALQHEAIEALCDHYSKANAERGVVVELEESLILPTSPEKVFQEAVQAME